MILISHMMGAKIFQQSNENDKADCLVKLTIVPRLKQIIQKKSFRIPEERTHTAVGHNEDL